MARSCAYPGCAKTPAAGMRYCRGHVRWMRRVMERAGYLQQVGEDRHETSCGELEKLAAACELIAARAGSAER